MTQGEPLRLAVFGLGFMGSTHLKALKTIDDAKLVAVFEVDEKRLSGDLTAVRGNIGGPGEMCDFSAVTKYRDLDAALADPEVDAVDICLPTDQHAAAVLKALRAGKHVLVEKPLALDGDTADALVEEARRTGRLLMAAQVLRFMPDYIVLRDAVHGGKLGSPRFATFRRRCAAPGWGGWLQDPSKSGGGVFDLLIHDVDMCLQLFGKPEAVAATGVCDGGRGIDCLDAALFYGNGMPVSVTGGWHNPGAFPFSMEYTVTFDGGTIDFHSAGRVPTLYASDGTETVLPRKEQDGYAAEVAYFVDCCRAGREPEICPPQQSADAVKLMLLLLEARQRNGEKMPCRI
jgi:predicted dehydrogenase